ncbi:MAG: hypothetical protein R3F20_17260 [Planctomycetota bacterium]
MSPSPLLVVLIAGLLAPGPRVVPHAHPADGPDVDLRVRVEEGVVRLQAVMNLAFCDEVAFLPRAEEEAVTRDEVPEMRKVLLETFAREVALEVDGIAVAPARDEFEMLPFDAGDASQYPRSGMLAVIKFRVELEYPLNEAPRSVGLTWRLHPINTALEDFAEVPIDVNAQWTAFGEVRIVTLTRNEPQFVWHAPAGERKDRLLAVPAPAPTRETPSRGGPIALGVLALAGGLLVLWRARRGRIPALVAVCVLPLAGAWLWDVSLRRDAGPPLPDRTAAAEAFGALHANIYRAFDYGDEDRVYDALARSVTGPLLDEVYDEVYRSLVMQEHGGAVGRVRKVERLATEVHDIGLSPDGGHPLFRVDCRWRVEGEVFHWGHTHTRTNEYFAEYSVLETDAGWRIEGHRVIEQFRVAAEGEVVPATDGGGR